MENETKPVEEVVEEETLTDESSAVDWEAKAKEAIGRAKRAETQLKKLKEAPEEKSPAPNKKEGFDYAEKTFIRNVLGATPEDYEWVREVIQTTGKSLDDLETSKYFKAELAERREARVSKEAIPTGTKRSTSTAKDEVSYWANKPFSEVPKELRREVLNAQMKKESQASKFTDRPVG